MHFKNDIYVKLMSVILSHKLIKIFHFRQVPQPIKVKILKRHPELQQKPPFISYC